jgi:hypothetical protein
MTHHETGKVTAAARVDAVAQQGKAWSFLLPTRHFQTRPVKEGLSISTAEQGARRLGYLLGRETRRLDTDYFMQITMLSDTKKKH